MKLKSLITRLFSSENPENARRYANYIRRQKMKGERNMRRAQPDCHWFFEKNRMSFQDNLRLCGGNYEQDSIFIAYKNNVNHVKNMEFHIDSMEFRYPSLTALFYIATREAGKLSVVDFGGAAGNLYFQYRDLFRQAHIKTNWQVVELPTFAAYAQEHLANEELRFSGDINQVDFANTCTGGGCVLCSGSIQYLEKPYAILDTIVNKKVKYILIDRLPTTVDDNGEDECAIQHVYSTYEAHLPVMLFSTDKLMSYFNQIYRLTLKWRALDYSKQNPYYGFLFEIT